jgi:hypothetical protein
MPETPTQDRYAGDIGDYVKVALLKHLAVGRRLGIAGYRHPDESHTDDGRHTAYLHDTNRWRALDPAVFDALCPIPCADRSIEALRDTGLLPGSQVMEPLLPSGLPWPQRSEWRRAWFVRTVAALAACDLIFADPDNRLVDDDPRRRSRRIFAKQIPLAEAQTLAQGRVAVIYHHNTRFRGGHDAEVAHWLERLGPGTLAVRANAWNCRTFFVLNPDAEIVARTQAFCARWRDHAVRLHG